MDSFYAKRANKILKITEDSLEKYIAQGYTITDMKGNVIKKGTPHDINQLTAECKAQEKEIEKLKGENAKLKEEVTALKAEIEKFKSEPISAEPKATRKRKQVTEEE